MNPEEAIGSPGVRRIRRPRPSASSINNLSAAGATDSLDQPPAPHTVVDLPSGRRTGVHRPSAVQTATASALNPDDATRSRRVRRFRRLDRSVWRASCSTVLPDQPPAVHTAADLPPASEMAVDQPRDNVADGSPDGAAYEFPRQMMRNYWELNDICDGSISEQQELDDRGKSLEAAIVAKGKAEGENTGLIASADDIFELAQLTTKKEYLHAKEACRKPLRQSILSVLRKQPVLPVESRRDVILAKELKDYYDWSGAVYCCEGFHSEECREEIHHNGLAE